MHPVLFSSGPFTVYTYGVCVALAVAAAWLLTLRLAKSASYPLTTVTDFLFIAFIAGIAGARAFYVFQHADEFAGRWLAVLYLNQGGLVWYGGFLGASAAGVLFAKAKRLPVPAWADLFAPALPLAHAIGRIGCFMNGCCFGKQGLPVQLMEAALLAALSGFLFARFFHRKKEGEIAAFYLIGYGLIRFALEYWRGDQLAYAGLTIPQWISLLLVAAGVMLLKRPSPPCPRST